MTVTLGHISDLHLLDVAGASWASFLNKRLTGGANLVLNRARTHQVELVERAVAELDEADVTHVAVTGDLSNLALDAEFRLARRVLDDLGDGRRVSVIPGNHDCYTYRSAKNATFERHFARFQTTDLPHLTADGPYPFVKWLSDVALVGLSSAVPTPPLFATGRVSRPQLEVLPKILAHPDVRGRYVVVLVHHHLVQPTNRRFDQLRRLTNAGELLDVLLHGGVDLVLHGHNHRPSLTELPRPDGSGLLRIVEAGSTSAIHETPEDCAGKYNVYTIDDGVLRQMTRYSYRPSDNGTVGRFHPWKTVEFGA